MAMISAAWVQTHEKSHRTILAHVALLPCMYATRTPACMMYFTHLHDSTIAFLKLLVGHTFPVSTIGAYNNPDDVEA